MRVCIYGTNEDRQMLASALSECNALSFRKFDTDRFDNYDDLIQAIRQIRYDFIIIMKDNADGMEGVIAVKSLFSEMPVIWFSNDRGFGAQSYRLNTAYFHEKPVTTQILSNALTKCMI